jgi:hypothetical protein
MVSLRDAIFVWGCGPRHESADSPSLRSARGQGWRGRRGVGRNAAPPCHFFGRGWVEKNSTTKYFLVVQKE